MSRQSDFWWLTPEEAATYRYVCVGHQEPYSDQPDSGKSPLLMGFVYSLDDDGNPSTTRRRHPLDFVPGWRDRFHDINVFRSIKVFDAEQGGRSISGPFVIDIDRQLDMGKEGYVVFVNDALRDTCRIVHEFLKDTKMVGEEDLRIFFSGHKGFHIEVRPQALGIDCSGDRSPQFEILRKNINGVFGKYNGNPFIDAIHDCVRLHHSINRWIRYDGELISWMSFELSLSELETLSADGICLKSQAMALSLLSST